MMMCRKLNNPRLYRDRLYSVLHVFVKFFPAVARLFCLALLGSLLNIFAQNKVDLCKLQIKNAI